MLENIESRQMQIGAHMTIGKGLKKAIEDALSIGANTMQVFTRNPRGGKAKDLNEKDLAQAHALMAEHHFAPWVAHAPYTINLASSKIDLREFGVATLIEDLQRVNIMGGGYLVVHSGSHTGQGVELGHQLLVKNLNKILPHTPKGMFLLIEGMAGSGSELGHNLEQLAEVLAKVEDNSCLGVCLDTAHLFGAGYDVRDWSNIWAQITATIGSEKVKVLHLNDSACTLNSKKDRHAGLGLGEIGLDAFREIINHPLAQQVSVILETPNELPGWQAEIALLKSMIKA